MSRTLVDSGIKWLGKIPSNWSVCKVKNKHAYHKIIVGEKSDNYERIALTLNGVIKRDKEDANGLQPENYNSYQLVHEEDLIFKLIDLENVNTSRIGKSDYEGITSPAYIVLTPKENNNYGTYYFLNMWYQEIFNNIGGNGVRSAINKDDLLNVPYLNISLEEQTKIANYLDKKCSKIDKVIEDNNKEIELLEEYVVSFIDKQFKLNDKTKKIKHNVIVRNEKGNVTNGEKYIGLENIEGFTTKYIETKTDNTNSDGKKFYKGDLLINKLRPYLAKSYLAEFDGVCTGELEVISNYNGNMDYLKYFTISNKYLEIVNASTYGTKMPRANWNFIKELEIPDIGIIRENEIVKDIKMTLTKVDKVIEYRKKIIEKLEEYKKSLIYEVVTGKKEV